MAVGFAQGREGRPRRIPVGWLVVAATATMVALVSARYFVLPIGVAGAGESGEHFEHFPARLLPHIAGGVVALLLGPWQFASRLRTRKPQLHRWMGYIYFSAIAVGATGGMLMAFVSMGGIPGHLGFGLLAVAWIVTAAVALRAALHGDFERHRQWMIRNYALTFAAVTLRIELPLMTEAMHLAFLVAYPIVSWLCWVPNAIVAEALVRRR